MPRRTLAVQLTLVVAALATVATSGIDQYTLTDTATGKLEAGTWRVEIVPSDAFLAVTHELLHLTLWLARVPGTPTTRATIIPDDPELPAEIVALGENRVDLFFDLTTLCPPGHVARCTVGVTIEIPPQSYVDITATATAISDSPYPAEAAIDVELLP